MSTCCGERQRLNRKTWRFERSVDLILLSTSKSTSINYLISRSKKITLNCHRSPHPIGIFLVLRSSFAHFLTLTSSILFRFLSPAFSFKQVHSGNQKLCVSYFRSAASQHNRPYSHSESLSFFILFYLDSAYIISFESLDSSCILTFSSSSLPTSS